MKHFQKQDDKHREKQPLKKIKKLKLNRESEPLRENFKIDTGHSIDFTKPFFKTQNKIQGQTYMRPRYQSKLIINTNNKILAQLCQYPPSIHHNLHLSPKQQINKSIMNIQQILKNGTRLATQIPIKKQQNNNNKRPEFLERILNKNSSCKANLLDTMSSETEKPTVQTDIKDFRLIKELGRGKYGVVSLARHKKTGLLFAIKAISKKAVSSENVLKQIIREVKIQSFLNHANIVKLFHVLNDKQNLYLITEYCNDGQLYHLLCKKKKISESDTKIYIKEICNAVSELHRYNIIHRDLKPQNIVLSFGMTKLCDFGWSVATKDTLRSTFCGTPLYVSPQLLNGNNYSQKIDLWAIGIIAFEMLTGHIPFKINSEKELIKIIDESIVYPGNMSTEGRQFIQSLLDKNPDSRATIDEILQHRFLRSSWQSTSLATSKSTETLNTYKNN